MCNIKIEIIKEIDSIKEIWKSLDEQIEFELGYDWYKNNSGVLTDETLYFTLWDKNEIVLIVPIHLVKKDIIWSFNNPIKFINGKNYNFGINLENKIGEEFKYILITSPFGFKSDFINIENLEEQKKCLYIEVMLDEINRFKKQEGYDEVFFLYLNESSSLQKNLLSRGYRTIPIIFDCVSKCEYTNFEEYLTFEIQSSKQRREIRREIKVFSKNGFKIEIVSNFSNVASRLAYLEGELLKKYGYGDSVDLVYSENWYKQIDKTYGEQSKVFIIKDKDEEIIGFSLFVCDKNMKNMSAKATGFDYAKIPENSYCYFNVVYYEPINYAIEKKIKSISFGCEMYEVKRKRGCNYEEYYLTFQNENIIMSKEEYNIVKRKYIDYLKQF